MSWMLEQQAAKRKAQKAKQAKTGVATRKETTVKVVVPSNYDIWLSQCESDWKQLKLIADHEERNRHKPAKLDAYRDYLQGWMDAGNTHQNKVLIMNLIWAFDVAEFEWMLTLADYAVKTKQINTLFKRDIPTFIYDEIIKGANDRFKNDDRSQEPILLAVLSRIETEQWKPAPHFIPASGYYKLGGQIAQRDEQWQLALDRYVKAKALKDDVGVNGIITQMQKKLADDAEKSPPPPSDSQNSADARDSASAESGDSQTVLNTEADDASTD